MQPQSPVPPPNPKYPPLQPHQPADYVPQTGQPFQAPPLNPFQPPPSPAQPTDYQFIMEHPAAPKKSALAGPTSMGKRLALVAVGFLIFIMVAVILFSLLTRPSADSTTMLRLSQQQTELVRVAGIAIVHPEASKTTKNLAFTTQLTLQTDSKTLKAYLDEQGQAVDPKALPLGQNKATDQALTAAKSSGNFDQAFTKVMQEQLTAYSSTLRQAFTNTKNPRGQELFSKQYDQAQLLLKQSQQL